MKSGDKFIHNKSNEIYTLQKLPSFNLWILIGEPKDLKGVVHPCYWKGINKDSDSALGAFGGCYEDFTPVIEEQTLITGKTGTFLVL